MGSVRPRERGATSSIAAATLAAAAAWSSTGRSLLGFTVARGDQRPVGQAALKQTIGCPVLGEPSLSMPSVQRSGAQHTTPPSLVAVAGAVAAIAAAAARLRAAAAPRGKGENPNGAFMLGQPVQAHLSAARGLATTNAKGRGARIVAYLRFKVGTTRKDRKQILWMDLCKNYKGKHATVYKMGKPKAMKGLKMQYINRYMFKRIRKRLWCVRISANCKLHGLNYSRFIMRMKEANMIIDRKTLSQLGVYDRPIFTNIMNVAAPYWPRALKEKMNPPKPFSIAELDKMVIDNIEKRVPELYTDDTIRFNRQVHMPNGKDGYIQYTVDVGTKEEWQEILAKNPELQNFEIPDYWLENPNAQREEIGNDLLKQYLHVDDEFKTLQWQEFENRVKYYQKDDEKRIARGEEPWPKKEGVSREDWFKDDPQTWF